MDIDSLWQGLGILFGSHPWHGVALGEPPYDVVSAFIEMVPTDTVKYELDKVSGLLRVDRPQKYSNVIPCLYGLLPKTLCADRVAERGAAKVGRPLVGDGDPLDICVLTERTIAHGNVLVDAVPIGGLRMIDNGEADDKIVAVLRGDAAYGAFRNISDLPPAMLSRLRHYFLTYKQSPDIASAACEIAEVYDQAEALEMIGRAVEDYRSKYSGLQAVLTEAIRRL